MPVIKVLENLLESAGFLALFGMATYFTLEAIQEWNTYPTVTISSWTPLKDLEFPAITVCPLHDARWRGFLEILRKTDPDGAGALELYQNIGDKFQNDTMELIIDLVIHQTRLNFWRLPNKWKKDLLQQTFENFTEAAIHSQDPFASLMIQTYQTWGRQSSRFRIEVLISILKGTARTPNESLHLAAQRIDPNETISISTLERSVSNLTAELSFYLLVQIVQFSHQLTGTMIQSFLIDYLTQKVKYHPELSAEEWSAIREYFGRFVSVDSIPGTVFHDMANMAEPKVSTLMDVECYGGRCAMKSNQPRFVRDPDIWQFHNEIFASSSYGCLGYNLNSSCEQLKKSTSHIPKHFPSHIQDFLETIQQPIHFQDVPDGNYYSYPMVPFCWFGGPLQWLGDVVVDIQATDSAFDYYQAAYRQSDRRKLLRWCNVFKKSFPIRNNCYTVDNLKQKVQQVGTDYGFSFVLENYFGQNAYQKGKASHVLYLHEQGTLPDRFGILGSGIELEYGKKHDITITAGHQKHTQPFADLDQGKRDCILQNEGGKHRGHFKITKKYATTTCIMEHLIDLSVKQCQCMPWDVAQYLNQPQVPTCLHIGRICVENAWNNRSNIEKAHENCPKPCEQLDYFVRDLRTSNLNENAMVIDLPNQAMPSFTVAYFNAPFYNNVSNELVAVTWKNISNLQLNQERVKYMTMVGVNFGAGYGTVLESDIRASFSDKLGTVGGTFGIFVGASFLSIGSMLASVFSQLKNKLSAIFMKDVYNFE